MLKLTIVKEKCGKVKKTRMKGVGRVYYDGCGLYDMFSDDPMWVCLGIFIPISRWKSCVLLDEEYGSLHASSKEKAIILSLYIVFPNQ